MPASVASLRACDMVELHCVLAPQLCHIYGLWVFSASSFFKISEDLCLITEIGQVFLASGFPECGGDELGRPKKAGFCAVCAVCAVVLLPHMGSSRVCRLPPGCVQDLSLQRPIFHPARKI